MRVERCLGPSGYAQRTSYAIDQPGMPTRQLTRTVVIRPARDERADNPNLPPTYDQAVTGKDRSVLVEGGSTSNQPPRGPAGVPNQGVPNEPPPPVATAPGPMPRFAPPPFSQVPRAQNNTASSRPIVGATQPSAPPGYTRNPSALQSAPAISRDRSVSFERDDQTAPLLGANNWHVLPDYIRSEQLLLYTWLCETGTLLVFWLAKQWYISVCCDVCVVSLLSPSPFFFFFLAGFTV